MPSPDNKATVMGLVPSSSFFFLAGLTRGHSREVPPAPPPPCSFLAVIGCRAVLFFRRGSLMRCGQIRCAKLTTQRVLVGEVYTESVTRARGSDQVAKIGRYPPTTRSLVCKIRTNLWGRKQKEYRIFRWGGGEAGAKLTFQRFFVHGSPPSFNNALPKTATSIIVAASPWTRATIIEEYLFVAIIFYE